MVERNIPVRLDLTDDSKRSLEILETGPSVTIIRPEAREVDIAQKQHIIRLDVKAAVAPGVARCVDYMNAHLTEVKDVTTAESMRVRPRSKMKVFNHYPLPNRANRLGKTVHAHEGVKGRNSSEVGFVDMHRFVGKQMVAGNMILVEMAVQYAVNALKSVTPRGETQRRINNDGFLASAHDHRVPHGVLPTVITEDDGYGTDR